jgi:hypothetical protein
VIITVSNTLAPVGATDSYSVPADLFVEAEDGLLDNDTDQNNGTLTAILASGPTHGILTLYEDGAFSYVPDEDFTGTDSFSYYPTDDDGPGALTTVNITITDHAPEADDDTAITNEDTAVTLSVLTNDTDADSDPLEILGASDGLFGTTVVNANGTITYTPYANWNGTDTFAYVIDDGYGRLAIATATVTVNPVNDAPVISGVTTIVQRDTPLDIDLRTLVTDVETDDENLTFAVSNPMNGTVELLADGHTARFTPTTGYNGTASFGLSVTDTGDGTSSALTTTGTAAVAVNAPPQVMNSTHVYHLAPGQTVSIFTFYSDPDGDPVTLDSYTQPSHGSVAPAPMGPGFVYTAPAQPFVGSTTFTFVVSDGRGGTASATITVTLTNQPPQGTDVSMSTSMNTPVSVYPSYYDPDGDPLTITSIAQPPSGYGSVALDPSGMGVVYTPPTGFTGTVTFSYTVDDGHGGTLVIHVTITVTA